LVLGLGLAVLGAAAFSGKAIIVKLAYRYGVDAVTLLMFRMLFGLPFFLGLAWWAGRGKPALTRHDLLVVAGLGFTGYYLASFLDFAGLAYINASFERLILYLNPTLVLFIGVFFLGHKVKPRQWLAFAVSYAGVLVVFGHELWRHGFQPAQSGAGGGSGLHDVALGAGLVFASAFSYAIYLAGSGHVVQRLGALRLTGLATSVACMLCVLQFLLLRPLSAALVPSAVIGLSLLNALLCTLLPVVMVMMAIERIGASMTAQTGMVGPLATLLMGVFILDEPFTLWIAAGTLLVLLGVGLLARSR
jgi:drug/metabolite transporter (DMT)-like permease